jgi:hypothetical protein
MMGRKGVSKRKKAKAKAKSDMGVIATLNERKAMPQPAPLADKEKAAPRDNKKR